MVFYSVESVTRKVEIDDIDIINALSEEEREEFRKITDEDEKLDFLDEIGWESNNWIDMDSDCEDSWIKTDFDIDLMEEI